MNEYLTGEPTIVLCAGAEGATATIRDAEEHVNQTTSSMMNLMVILTKATVSAGYKWLLSVRA